MERIIDKYIDVEIKLLDQLLRCAKHELLRDTEEFPCDDCQLHKDHDLTFNCAEGDSGLISGLISIPVNPCEMIRSLLFDIACSIHKENGIDVEKELTQEIKNNAKSNKT